MRYTLLVHRRIDLGQRRHRGRGAGPGLLPDLPRGPRCEELQGRHDRRRGAGLLELPEPDLWIIYYSKNGKMENITCLNEEDALWWFTS